MPTVLGRISPVEVSLSFAARSHPGEVYKLACTIQTGVGSLKMVGLHPASQCKYKHDNQDEPESP